MSTTYTKKPPVFICGFPRSGTTLLYHMLLSSGGFANYRSESWVFDLLVPKFGNLRSARSRERMLDLWVNSDNGRIAGIDASALKARVMSECTNGGEFLRIVMESIARTQHVDRWAETTPTHILYIPQIHRTLPEALVVHLIRDGRDAALSYTKKGWLRTLAIDRDRALLVAGLYWEWMIRVGRRTARVLGPRYVEARFEDLVERPHETLERIGAFIGHELDYERILEVGVGSVRRPNTSFRDAGEFHPVGRWRESLAPDRLRALEGVIGPFLRELGYETGSPSRTVGERLEAARLRATYVPYFELKHALKTRTPLGRYFVKTDLFERPLDPV